MRINTAIVHIFYDPLSTQNQKKKHFKKFAPVDARPVFVCLFSISRVNFYISQVNFWIKLVDKNIYVTYFCG